MGINKGLEKQMAKEILSLIINDDEKRVRTNYKNYIEYTERYSKENDNRILSIVKKCYEFYRIL